MRSRRCLPWLAAAVAELLVFNTVNADIMLRNNVYRTVRFGLSLVFFWTSLLDLLLAHCCLWVIDRFGEMMMMMNGDRSQAKY